MQVHQEELAATQNQIIKFTAFVERLATDDNYVNEREGAENRPQYQQTLKAEDIYEFNPSDSSCISQVRSMNSIEIPENSSIMLPIKLPKQVNYKSDYGRFLWVVMLCKVSFRET